MSRMPSHSLQWVLVRLLCCKEDGIKPHNIVVAVPMKVKLAFSSPAFVGWTLVSFATGSELESFVPAGWSRVGGLGFEGSIEMCFMGGIFYTP